MDFNSVRRGGTSRPFVVKTPENPAFSLFYNPIAIDGLNVG
jgi:hypothetical protein